jgi:hypothetical protein
MSLHTCFCSGDMSQLMLLRLGAMVQDLGGNWMVQCTVDWDALADNATNFRSEGSSRSKSMEFATADGRPVLRPAGSPTSCMHADVVVVDLRDAIPGGKWTTAKAAKSYLPILMYVKNSLEQAVMCAKPGALFLIFSDAQVLAMVDGLVADAKALAAISVGSSRPRAAVSACLRHLSLVG